MGQLRCPSPAPAFLACGTVRVCCHPHHREHRAGHYPPPVYICLHWSPAFQGEALTGQRPFPGQLEGRDESQPLLIKQEKPQILKASDPDSMVSKLGKHPELFARQCLLLVSDSLNTLAIVSTVTHWPCSYRSSHQRSSLHLLSRLSTAPQPSCRLCCKQAVQSMVLAGMSGIIHSTQEPLHRPTSPLIRSSPYLTDSSLGERSSSVSLKGRPPMEFRFLDASLWLLCLL